MWCLVFHSNAAASFEGFLRIVLTGTREVNFWRRDSLRAVLVCWRGKAPGAHRNGPPPTPKSCVPCPIQVARCCGLMSWCNKAGGDSKQKEHCCGSRCYRANPGEIHGRPLPRDFQVEMFSDDCVGNESPG